MCSDARPGLHQRKALPGCALLAGLLLTANAWADVYVIGHSAAPVQSLSKAQVTDLYLGRQRTLPNGDFVLLFDQGRDSQARQRFYKAFASMSLQQVNAYWSRLMYTGQVQAPYQLADDRAVLDIVKRNPSAIGYLVNKPSDSGVRILAAQEE